MLSFGSSAELTAQCACAIGMPQQRHSPEEGRGVSKERAGVGGGGGGGNRREPGDWDWGGVVEETRAVKTEEQDQGVGHKQVGSQVGPGRLGAKFLAVSTEGKAEALAVLVWCRVGLGTGAHRVTLMEGMSHGFNALPAAGLFCLCHLNYLETRQ